MLEVTVSAARRAIGDDPERFVERLRALPATSPSRSLAARVSVEDARVGGVDTLVSTPEGWQPGAPTCLYAHGGGYVSGTPRHVSELTARLALATGHRVASVDYRLAPEHPFPAGLDDAVAVWSALGDEGDAPRWVAGDSAGGGLALALCLRLRDEGRALPACFVGFSPFVDVSRTAADASAAPFPSVVNLKFAIILYPAGAEANFKFNTTRESKTCSCPS